MRISTKNIIQALILSVPVIASATPIDVFTVKVGDVVQGTIQPGPEERPFQLPAGNWVVLAHEVGAAGNRDHSTPTINILLGKFTPGNLYGIIRVITPGGPLSVSSKSGWNSNPCPNDMKNVYFVERYDKNPNLPECTHTQPVLVFGASHGSYWEGALQVIHDHNVKTVPPLIYANYQDYTYTGYVAFSAWLNPEMAGFKRDELATKNTSKWAVNNISGPYKDYIDRVNAWSMSMAKAVKASYKKDLTPIPDFPY